MTSLFFRFLISLQPSALLIILSPRLVCKPLLLFLAWLSRCSRNATPIASKPFWSTESFPVLHPCIMGFPRALSWAPSYLFSLLILFPLPPVLFGRLANAFLIIICSVSLDPPMNVSVMCLCLALSHAYLS